MTNLHIRLDEKLRDAQLAYYLKTISPAVATENTARLKTVEDLSKFWLLDMQVSQPVVTSLVASAIASLQQYIHSILHGLEPGYGPATKTRERVKIWTEEMSRYSVWAGHQKLLYYPEIYLDPNLRNTDSDNFKQLINDISQSRIQPAAIESAVKSYLTRFEEVANLKILNGYIDGADFANSKYYFIAKSRSEPTYFWRSLNMAERPYNGTKTDNGQRVKQDHPEPYAWSDWKKADIPIPQDAIEHTIRPVWFNNRLFITWAQCIHQDPAGVSGEKRDPQLLMSYCYKKSDETWSAPRTVLNNFVNNGQLGRQTSRPVDETPLSDLRPEELKSRINTVSVQIRENSQDFLLIAIMLFEEQRELKLPRSQYVIGVYDMQNRDDHMQNNTPLFLSSVSIDKNFTHISGAPPRGTSLKEALSQAHYKLAYEIHKHPINELSEPVIYLQSKQEKNNTQRVTAKPDLVHSPKLPRGAISCYIDYQPNELDLTIRLTLDPTLLSNDQQASIFVVRQTMLGSPRQITPLISGKDSYHVKFSDCDLIRTSEVFQYGLTLHASGQHWYGGSIAATAMDSFSTPKLSSNNSVQYLDFSDSLILHSDNGLTERQPIRLNTLLATELTGRAENSLDELFSRETQQLQEPKIFDTDPDQPMDFHGPNGRYYTELFLNLPWLIAHQLNAERQYADAENWINHLFDPGLRQPQCWKTVPLTGTDVPSYAARAPHDPHMISQSYPVHARKALYLLYLDILINRGDAAYRELTPDSLVEAKLWYRRAKALLGARPVVQTLDQWSAISLKELSANPAKERRALEKTLRRLSTNGLADDIQAALPALQTSGFLVPLNPELLKRWDIVESRLDNLQHSIDISGKPLHLPLFATPIDPTTLVSVRKTGASYGADSQLQKPVLSQYRFKAMHSHAVNAVDSVIQFGATLLSLIERQEQAHVQELQQQQAWDMAKISVELQTQALRVDSKNRDFLNACKQVIQGRLTHYDQLLEKDVTPDEAEAGRLYLRSAAAEVDSSIAQVVAGSLMMIPNIFGLANGGARWEGTAHAASALAQLRATQLRAEGSHLERGAQFARRREEWTLNRNQAQLELAQIGAQIAQSAEQEKLTRLQLKQAETALTHARDNYDFLSKRFTNKQLYQWLNNQLSTLYEQAYEAALDLCLATEACWQYECADYTSRFIQPGSWSATYRGLSAGESLKTRLMNMLNKFLQADTRGLPLEHIVSLRLLKDKDKTSVINRSWPQIKASLLEEGKCDFELTHTMFEEKWKGQGHYLRRIKTLSVTIPGIVSPYENISATLTQTSSLMYLTTDTKATSIKDTRIKQHIALSSGDDDSGVFHLDLLDDRYLPFEYTGAVSTWTLTFPNHAAQKDMLDSLTDIIVKVKYTARKSGVAR
ncbi:neuraminidase-like domain-containing protein [Pseudomonas sp. Ant30-3]|uniref:Tc toxin subunit A-related protein n=1 Tax=Pseudomonas sp. Ant30-3 TaxID=1488328 RepID=UPI00048C5333|nr:neuraminidase-like domain-containing protein [Pseudomonas sp. Ant30-3]